MLSSRTRTRTRIKDQDIGYIAEYLTAIDIDLKEVRVVGDEERAIVDALNALRHRCVFSPLAGPGRPTLTSPLSAALAPACHRQRVWAARVLCASRGRSTTFVLGACCGSKKDSWTSPSHGENRGSSPLGSASNFNDLAPMGCLFELLWGVFGE